MGEKWCKAKCKMIIKHKMMFDIIEGDFKERGKKNRFRLPNDRNVVSLWVLVSNFIIRLSECKSTKKNESF